MKDFSITGTYTDLYQISMAQVYHRSGKSKNRAVFDYFFRKLPFQGGYVVFAGLGTVLEILQDLRFTGDDIDYLGENRFDKEFLNALRDFTFQGNVYAMPEGEIIFPNESAVIVEGSLLETQLVETLLLNIINFQSLVATKAARMRYVAGKRILSDFGLRRAQGLGGYHATRAALVGGFDSTSNVKAARDFDVPVVGTMAHALIQSYDDELIAFRSFAEHRPDNCILLVDTYDTLKSGVPNAIKVGLEMKARGQKLAGIRLDSGDLAYLSRKSRQMLDEAGLTDVKIAVSNQLDEHVIKSLLDQHAPIDIFGVGTSLVTGHPDAALDGVYKLAQSEAKPRIKLSENLKKLTLPDKKQVHRIMNSNGEFYGADVISLHDEPKTKLMHHPYEPDKAMKIEGLTTEPLLKPVMISGKIVGDLPSLKRISAHTGERLALLPPEYKRFQFPHIYKVGISTRLRDLRDELKSAYKKQE
jgi:nicotinate phosphoribosyltransferase